MFSYEIKRIKQSGLLCLLSTNHIFLTHPTMNSNQTFTKLTNLEVESYYQLRQTECYSSLELSRDGITIIFVFNYFFTGVIWSLLRVKPLLRYRIIAVYNFLMNFGAINYATNDLQNIRSRSSINYCSVRARRLIAHQRQHATFQ